MIYFKEKYNFPRFKRDPTFSRGSNFFQVGVLLFPRGGLVAYFLYKPI